MTTKLGILMAGLNGAIGTTTAAGLNLVQRKKKPAIGMQCESTTPDGSIIANRLDAPLLKNIIVSGWDIESKTLEESLHHHQVLSPEDIRAVDKEVLSRHPIPAPTTSHNGTTTDAWGWRIERLRRDIRRFKADNGIDVVVVVNALPTHTTGPWSDAHETIAGLQTACAAQDESVTPSMEYACATILESAGFANFTPNHVEVPAIAALALEMGVPIAGHDGKTGQTLLKTALAPVFKLRDLHVRGWFSTNILGNLDGRALHQPEACQTKVQSKQGCLDSILGYKVEDHQVHIHYYRPRKDNKEAWDNIDLEGFLGYPLELKLNFLCRDSILAAPLVIDLARLLAVSMARKESGLMAHLSLFFKSPQLPSYMSVEHDLFKQRQIFMEWVDRVVEDQ